MIQCNLLNLSIHYLLPAALKVCLLFFFPFYHCSSNSEQKVTVVCLLCIALSGCVPMLVIQQKPGRCINTVCEYLLVFVFSRIHYICMKSVVSLFVFNIFPVISPSNYCLPSFQLPQVCKCVV